MPSSPRPPSSDACLPLMRMADLLVYLRISRSTAYNWIEQNRLPRGVRIGGVRLFDQRAVAAALGLDADAR